MSKKRKKQQMPLIVVIALIIITAAIKLFTGNETKQISSVGTNAEYAEITAETFPEYDGEPYIVVNGNKAYFDADELTTEPFEIYSELDELGRCGAAYANICIDLMPTESRESISSVHPSGWQSVKYDFIEGKSLYNRSHLIGFQLAGENANEKNLITGTRYLNAETMLPFENEIADYVKETDNHVMYRVTPYFEGDDLIAKGVLMEAYSVEDKGKGVSFNVFCYNIQPGVYIDYSTGNNHATGEIAMDTREVYIAFLRPVFQRAAA